jgi:hypothetical protein
MEAKMKVEITTPPGIFAEGSLERILSQQGAPYPHMVIEMKVTGSSYPVRVTLDIADLSTIVRLAKVSGIRQIQDVVR